MTQNYLTSVCAQFNYYKALGDKTFAQMSEEELFWKPDTEANSIAIIVNHIQGNMLSRWTNFLKEDGEKEWRNRDGEFESLIKSKTELIEKWENGWNCLFTALDSVNEDNFDTIIYIRNQGHSIVEAVNRQMMHYAYHVGQIAYLGRMIKGEKWTSLSIPKGGSKAYNENKFKQEKRREHFTMEFLEKK